MAKSPNIWIPKQLFQSQAFRSLRTPTAHVVLAQFWTKRQMMKTGYRRKQWEIANNGEITFTYREAKNKWGISASAFRTALDELRDKGFLDIARSGVGVHKATNEYTVSDRWKHYGTSDYEPPRSRPKGPINRGFRKGNQHGRNCHAKKTTVTGQHSPTVVGQHSYAESGTDHVVCTTQP